MADNIRGPIISLVGLIGRFWFAVAGAVIALLLIGAAVNAQPLGVHTQLSSKDMLAWLELWAERVGP